MDWRMVSVENSLENLKSKYSKKFLGGLLLRSLFVFLFLWAISFTVPAGLHHFFVVNAVVTLALGIPLALIVRSGSLKFLFVIFKYRALNFYEGLERQQQLYFNIIAITPFLGYVYAIDVQQAFIPLLALFFIYCLGVVAFDIIRIYVRLSTTLVGKALLAVGFAAGSNFAFALAGRVIGDLTHVPPLTFPHTLSFLAIAAIPFLFVFAGAIYIPVFVLLFPILIYVLQFIQKTPQLMKWLLGFQVNETKRRYVTSTFIFQIIFYLSVALVVPKFFFNMASRNAKGINSTIGKSIYEFDMYPGTECKSDSSYRYASLGDENYILASKKVGVIKFDPPKKCAL